MIAIRAVPAFLFAFCTLATAAMSALTNGWLPGEFYIDSASKARAMFAISGIGFFVSKACLVSLNWHALRRADSLALTAKERLLTRYEGLTWSIVGGSGLVSLMLAVTLCPRAARWRFDTLNGWKLLKAEVRKLVCLPEGRCETRVSAYCFTVLR